MLAEGEFNTFSFTISPMLKHSLRNFEPKAVAMLETDMWEAYYQHKFFRLFRLLLKLFRYQFGTKGITNLRLAYYSAKAAEIFRKSGDGNVTLKNLEAFYEILQKCSAENFDKTLAAKSELNWWIVHRHPKRGVLSEALAENMAILYSLPSKSLLTYGKLRATAMGLRDTAAHKDKLEPDWLAVQKCLSESYTELSKAVAAH